MKWLALRVPALYKDSEWSLPKLRLRGEQHLEKYRLQPVSPAESKALRACRHSPVTCCSSSRSTTPVPHQVIVNYREAFISARSSTYRLIEGADHGLSSEAWRSTYTSLLVNWFTEFVFGTQVNDQTAPAPVPANVDLGTAKSEA